MKGRLLWLPVALLGLSAVCFAKANGAWLRKVPQAEHERVNPLAGAPEAIAAGRNLFLDNCAKCHGKEAQGRHSRPPLRSDRIRGASDGDLAWLLKNGEVFKGMPRWAGLPEQERWQIIAYIRSLNSTEPEVQK
ncbi:MAG TPA: c-type cytochrome [Acidobacteriaceae bacterium]|jgi:mono/diheme cytochrome c family protein|nr:c-type cytochrome [Acidobacteriaceae bacterium]